MKGCQLYDKTGMQCIHCAWSTLSFATAPLTGYYSPLYIDFRHSIPRRRTMKSHSHVMRVKLMYPLCRYMYLNIIKLQLCFTLPPLHLSLSLFCLPLFSRGPKKQYCNACDVHASWLKIIIKKIGSKHYTYYQSCVIFPSFPGSTQSTCKIWSKKGNHKMCNRFCSKY